MRGLQRPSHRRRGCPKSSPEIRVQQSQDQRSPGLCLWPVSPTAHAASVNDAGRTHGQVGQLKAPGLQGGQQACTLTRSPSAGR